MDQHRDAAGGEGTVDVDSRVADIPDRVTGRNPAAAQRQVDRRPGRLVGGGVTRRGGCMARKRVSNDSKLAISGGAWLALRFLQIDVMLLIGICAALGMAWRLIS